MTAPGSSRTCKSCGQARAYPADFYDQRRTCKPCTRAERKADTASLTPEQRAARSQRGQRWARANPEKTRASKQASAARDRARDEVAFLARQRRATKALMDKRRAFLSAAKDVPCVDCGIKYPSAAMDFDHRDPATKKFNPSQMLTKKDAVILTEIAKCDVRCSNCHRIRHHEERQAAKQAVA